MPDAAVHVGSGKVRELYALDADRLLLVASDRISTFDVVLPTEIPDKGRVLTGLSAFWFARTREHLRRTTCSGCDPTDARPSAGGSTCCRSSASCAATSPARAGRTTGATGAVCGHVLPRGLRESDRLPEPIFTPATKAQQGHDENIDASRGRRLVGEERLARSSGSRSSSIASPPTHAAERGILIADTKFEFGIDADGRLVLADEAFTPDSSRFWPADEYEPGRPQPSFDKQFVRDYCETLGWDKTAPGPRAAGRRRRRHARPLRRGVRAAHRDSRSTTTSPTPEVVAAMRATVLVRPKPGILDPQGEAVRSSLRQLGFAVSEARVGRLVDLELERDRRRDGPGRGRAHVRAAAREPADRELPRSRSRRDTDSRRARGSRSSCSRARTTTGTPCSRSSGSAPTPCSSGTPTRTCRESTRVVLPGGFSYGDYLRCGAIARFAPVCRPSRRFAADGGPVLGICNGFQILCEAGLLPGVLRPNASLAFVCRDVAVRVERADTPFTSRCEAGQRLTIPVKHGEGCWFADAELLAELEAAGQIVLRYEPATTRTGRSPTSPASCNADGNVMGLMPHPEHAVDPLLGSPDGA